MFHLSCLRKILKITQRDKIRNDEVASCAESRNLSDMVGKIRIQLIGHIFRPPQTPPTKLAMNWVTHGGQRHRGRPKKTWCATVKEDLQRERRNWYTAPKIAQGQLKWNYIVARCCATAGGTRQQGKVIHLQSFLVQHIPKGIKRS